MKPYFKDKEAYVHRLLLEYEAVIMDTSSPHTKPTGKDFPLQCPPTHTHTQHQAKKFVPCEAVKVLRYLSLEPSSWIGRMEYGFELREQYKELYISSLLIRHLHSYSTCVQM